MKWQPIESAPRDGTTILIVNDGVEGDEIFIAEWAIQRVHSPDPNIEKFGSGDWCWQGTNYPIQGLEGDFCFHAYAWKPLPAKPRMTQKQKDEAYAKANGRVVDPGDYNARGQYIG